MKANKCRLVYLFHVQIRKEISLIQPGLTWHRSRRRAAASDRASAFLWENTFWRVWTFGRIVSGDNMVYGPVDFY